MYQAVSSVKTRSFLKETPEKGLTILAIPFGIAWTFYIKQQVKKDGSTVKRGYGI